MPKWPVNKAGFYWFSCILTWDMSIFADKRLKHNRPVIAVVHKDTQERIIIDIAVPADQNIFTKGGKVSTPSSRNKKNPQNHESESNTHPDWCTWNYLGKWEGLVCEVESTRYFWKPTVVSHPWYCPYLAGSVMSLSCRISAETWLRIPRKRTVEDHTIIIMKLCARSVFLHFV